MTDTELEARVKQLLADLGGDADTIADHLVELGVQGISTRADACPIFNYLKANDVPVTTVDGIYINGEDWKVLTPEPIERFIDAFDCEDYPDLIEAAS